MITRAPGRICIFGEHQDYLGHPVIAGAIDLCIYIQGEPRSDNTFIIHKRDFGETETFDYPAAGLIPYTRERDYFKSVPNVLRSQGITITHGCEVEVWSHIPMAAGASSSSALNVAWMKFLCELFQVPSRDDPLAIGELAFLSEVAAFNEPGGRMDQYISSLGGIYFLDFKQGVHEMLRPDMRGFVLIDSLHKKDTFGMLTRVKQGQMAALAAIHGRYPDRDLLEIDGHDLDFLPGDLHSYGQAAVLNYQLTMTGKEILKQDPIDGPRFGQYLCRQHRILRDGLQNTTPKIDRLLDIALDAGALGGKMNGSGGGGTLFVYAPGKQEQVVEQINRAELQVRTDIITIPGTSG